jgi:hypothetical protein
MGRPQPADEERHGVVVVLVRMSKTPLFLLPGSPTQYTQSPFNPRTPSARTDTALFAGPTNTARPPRSPTTLQHGRHEGSYLNTKTSSLRTGRKPPPGNLAPIEGGTDGVAPYLVQVAIAEREVLGAREHGANRVVRRLEDGGWVEVAAGELGHQRLDDRLRRAAARDLEDVDVAAPGEAVDAVVVPAAALAVDHVGDDNGSVLGAFGDLAEGPRSVVRGADVREASPADGDHHGVVVRSGVRREDDLVHGPGLQLVVLRQLDHSPHDGVDERHERFPPFRILPLWHLYSVHQDMFPLKIPVVVPSLLRSRATVSAEAVDGLPVPVEAAVLAVRDGDPAVVGPDGLAARRERHEAEGAGGRGGQGVGIGDDEEWRHRRHRGVPRLADGAGGQVACRPVVEAVGDAP